MGPFEVSMNKVPKGSRVSEIQQTANRALEAARELAPGAVRIQAIKKAGLLRKKADETGLVFAKRGRPPK
jgi:hypothetical protein